MVWPGKHVFIHKCLVGDHGAIDVHALERLVKDPLAKVDEMSNKNTAQHINEPDNLPALGAPTQLRARPGDVFLLHPDLPHTGGPNWGPNIRSMVYFRLSVNKREGISVEDDIKAYKSDMWYHYAIH